MLRFRNPSSNLDTQIRILGVLYTKLGSLATFGWEDMADIITSDSNLMTAYGYSGIQAANLSSKKSTSENSVKMNAKMMAEVYRLYGWIAPVFNDRSYPVRFTLLGQCAAENPVGALELIKQAALGYVNPSENMQKGKSGERVRFFPFVLKTIHDMGGYLYKHEMCMGPMSTNDNDPVSYNRMLGTLRQNRESLKVFETAFGDFCSNQGMSKVSVDNLTRLPISILRATGWVESERTKKVFSVSRQCLKLTQEGLDQLKATDDMFDLRLDAFKRFASDERASLIRVGLYGMLLRAGFVLGDEHNKLLGEDSRNLDHILKGKELLFSPYQTVRVSEVDEALGIGSVGFSAFDSQRVSKSSGQPIPSFVLEDAITDRDMVNGLNLPALRRSAESLAVDLRVAYEKEQSISVAVGKLFHDYRTYKQKEFYPLVADLFSIVGFSCQESRAGDNGARWDAIIVDDHESIPIEIKSPTEEEFLSLKGVRQALENKIILMSRKTHASEAETTSLAVGYRLPNARAEVSTLIEYFYNSFKVRIGIIGLETLLKLAMESVVRGRKPMKTSITELKGILAIEI